MVSSDLSIIRFINLKMFNLILYTSIFLWLLPPIRQYHGKYFYYFLILALTDPIVYLLKSFGIYSNFIMLFSVLLLVISVSNIKYTKRFNIITTLILFLVSFGMSYFNSNFQIIMAIFAKATILFLILKVVLIEVFELKLLNIYYFGIILLEITYITRFIAVLTDINTGLAFYLITQIFQFLIAIFYILFREDSKLVRFKLADYKV